MEKKKNGQLIIIGVLAVAILFMSIGFAAYSQTLNINGEVTVQPATWSVHWDTASFAQDANSVTVTTSQLTNTNVTFTATLEKPGDVAKFTVDAVNDGTFNANLDAITMSTLTTAQQKYLTYEVKYGNTTYTASASNLSDILAKTNGRKTVTVTVTYITPADSADLPQTAATVNLSLSLNYSQAAD